jgi:hypothetical protein
MNPLRKDDADTILQETIPTQIAIRRLINPLRRKTVENNMVGFKSGQTAYWYIMKDTLEYSETKALLTWDPLSEFHKAMLMAGCYGDMNPKYKDAYTHTHAQYTDANTHGTPDVAPLPPLDLSTIFKHPYMSKTTRADSTKNYPFMLNLMLQALEDRSDMVSAARSSYGKARDKSVCDCMRDFAAPSLMTIKHTEDDDATCGDGYKQDSCSVQNLVDYAMDGTGIKTSGLQSELKIMSLVENTRDRRRHRNDPILNEFDKYLVGKVLTTTFKSNTDLYDFANTYCSIVGFKDDPEGPPEPPVDANHYNDDPLSRYFREQGRKCPLSWKDVFANKAGAPPVTLATAVTEIKGWIRMMHPHNKLRSPKVTDSAKKDGISETASEPSSISFLSYKHYLLKYAAAFETCDQMGVPQYFTRITTYTNATHWHIAGEIWLLFSASFAFFWAAVIRSIVLIRENGSLSWKTCLDQNLVVTIHAIVPLILGGFGSVFLGYTINDQLWRDDPEETSSTSTTPNAKNEGMTIFASTIWIMYALLLLILFGIIFRIIRRIWNHAWTPRAKVADQNEHYKFLHQLMFGAQIAMDVPVIVGLTFIAVGTIMQRGVGDYYLISTVFVLFLSIGVTTHITNVLRLMHLIAQADIEKDNHAQKIKYNRVFIGVLIVVMLYLYMQLAGLDSYQGSSFGEIHQTLFVFVAFSVLCGGDLMLEFVCLFQEEDETNEYARFYRMIYRKTLNTVWIILIGIFFLNLHLYLELCQRSNPIEGRADVCTWWLSEA